MKEGVYEKYLFGYMNMIPKIIHYCWFGNNEKPKYVKECIDTRKKYAPDYEIKEWNESNCDINCNKWVKGAYKAKKWAFVADYFRLKALYDEGGVYLDTDMQLVAPLEKLVDDGYDAIWGFDSSDTFSAGIIISKKGHIFLKDLIGIYDNKQYDGDTINSIINKYFIEHGLKLNGLEQYSEKYNVKFYEANKISVDMGDGEAVVVDLHANSWVDGKKENHIVRCYLDYLAIHDEKINEAIKQIRSEYEDSMSWKIGRAIVKFLSIFKLDRLFFYLKKKL